MHLVGDGPMAPGNASRQLADLDRELEGHTKGVEPVVGEDRDGQRSLLSVFRAEPPPSLGTGGGGDRYTDRRRGPRGRLCCRVS